MPKCSQCGKFLKNSLALKIHVGRMHQKKGKAAKARRVTKPVAPAELDIREIAIDELIAIKRVIDERLAEVAQRLRLAGVMGQKVGRPPGRKPGPKSGRKAKSSKETGKPLAQYIHEVLSATEKGLSLKEIEAKVLAGGYPTTAESIYKPIMKVLSKGFKRVARGVYAVEAAVKSGEKAAKAAPAPAAKKPNSRAKKRGQFAQTSEQFVLGLMKDKGATTPQISKAWKAAGRGGVPSPTLSNLFRARKIKREPLKGEKGFLYTVA